MAKPIKSARVSPGIEGQLALDRHTDWEVAKERGSLRNGRQYLLTGPQGSGRTKRAKNRNACRGKVAY